ncbi:MAG: diguanylate cyclase [Roseibium sp.]
MLRSYLRKVFGISISALLAVSYVTAATAAYPVDDNPVLRPADSVTLEAKTPLPPLKYQLSAKEPANSSSFAASGSVLENPDFFTTVWNSPRILQLASTLLAIGFLASAFWRYLLISTHNRQLRRTQAELMSLNETLDTHVQERTRQLTREIEGRKRSQKILETFFNQSQTLNLVLDSDANIVRINKAWESALGFSRSELKSKPLVEFVIAEDHDKTNELLENLQQGGKADGFENRWHCADGSIATLRWSARPDTKNQLFYGSAQNITSEKASEEALKLSASVFTAADEGIMITDPRGIIIDVNQAFSEITGFEKSEVLGQNANMLDSGKQDTEFYSNMWRSLSETSAWRGEIWNRTKDGRIYPELLTISAVEDSDGNTANFVGLFSDISRIKEYERELEQLAQYDGLTGLPNRVLLADRLNQAMARARRHHQSIAIAFLDLDGFKAVNDTHGHAAGDQLLIEVANRFKSTLREEDTLARIGGDEFVAIITDLKAPMDCIGTLERIKSAAAEKLDLEGAQASVTASIGVTFYPQGEEIAGDQLERQADQAMYQAKLGGRNRYHFFEQEHVRASA